MTTSISHSASATGPRHTLPRIQATRPARSYGLRVDSVFREAWPLALCTIWLPLMFVLGLQGVVWALPGIVLSWRLVRRRTTRMPASAVLFGVALAWMLLGGVQVRLSSLPLFAYRWSLFLGAFAAEVYLINVPRWRVPTERIASWLATLWVAMVGFGWLAILAPVDGPSPLLRILPGPIARIEFIDSISAWRMAEVQGFLGFPLPRPAAPFPAANGWGCAMGLLFPIFLKVWLVEARPARRAFGLFVLAASAVPIIYSFNRGLWLSIVLAVCYFALRRIISGDFRALAVIAAGALLVSGAVLVTPLGQLAATKINTAGDSNASRNELVDLAIDGTAESPLLGHGAPERVRPDMPPIGTHGMLWYLLFVHGAVVTLLYLSWLGIEIVRSAPSRSPGSIWFHVVLVVAGMQTFIYGMLPQVVLIGIVAGLARREAASEVTTPARAPSPRSGQREEVRRHG